MMHIDEARKRVNQRRIEVSESRSVEVTASIEAATATISNAIEKLAPTITHRLWGLSERQRAQVAHAFRAAGYAVEHHTEELETYPPQTQHLLVISGWID